MAAGLLFHCNTKLSFRIPIPTPAVLTALLAHDVLEQLDVDHITLLVLEIGNITFSLIF